VERVKRIPAGAGREYNFCRIHKSPRVTPAMEVGIADHVWDLAELLA